MKITVKSGSTLVVLGDDAKKEAISGLAVGSEILVDEQALLRAASRTFFGRGNVANRIGWQTDRSHGSEALAMKFVMDHFRTCPRENLLVEISQQGSGAFSVWLTGAALSQMGLASLNASSVIRYELIGGALLAANPGS